MAKQDNRYHSIVSTTVNRKEFEMQLGIHKKVIGKPNLTICRAARFLFMTHQVIMLSTDLETAYCVALPANGAAPIRNRLWIKGKRGVPTAQVLVDKLMKAVKAIPKKVESVQLEMLYGNIDDKFPMNFRINGTITLETMNPDDYPTMPSPPMGTYYDIFTGADIDRVKVITGVPDDYRGHIRGALFNFRDGELVKTDGSRLHMVSIGTGAPYGNALVGMNALNILACKNVAGKIRGLRIKDDFLFVKLQDGYLCSKLIDAEYPDYSDLVDYELLGVISTGNRDLVTDTIKEASAIGDNQHKAIVLSLNGDITIGMVNPNIGEFSKTITGKIRYAGRPLEMAMDPNYVLDAINQLPDKEMLVMAFTGKDGKGPCLIESRDQSFRAAVMPMHI